VQRACSCWARPACVRAAGAEPRTWAGRARPPMAAGGCCRLHSGRRRNGPAACGQGGGGGQAVAAAPSAACACQRLLLLLLLPRRAAHSRQGACGSCALGALQRRSSLPQHPPVRVARPVALVVRPALEVLRGGGRGALHVRPLPQLARAAPDRRARGPAPTWPGSLPALLASGLPPPSRTVAAVAARLGNSSGLRCLSTGNDVRVGTGAALGGGPLPHGARPLPCCDAQLEPELRALARAASLGSGAGSSGLLQPPVPPEDTSWVVGSLPPCSCAEATTISGARMLAPARWRGAHLLDRREVHRLGHRELCARHRASDSTPLRRGARVFRARARMVACSGPPARRAGPAPRAAGAAGGDQRSAPAGAHLGHDQHAAEAVDGAPHIARGVCGRLGEHGIEVGVGILGLRPIFLR
jgi:hypothetical protein